MRRRRGMRCLPEVDAMRLRAPARPAALPALLRTGAGSRRGAGSAKAAGDGLTRGLGDCARAGADASGTREAASAAILPTATVAADRVGDGWADALATSAAAAGAVSRAHCESVGRGHGCTWRIQGGASSRAARGGLACGLALVKRPCPGAAVAAAPAGGGRPPRPAGAGAGRPDSCAVARHGCARRPPPHLYIITPGRPAGIPSNSLSTLRQQFPGSFWRQQASTSVNRCQF